MNASFLKLCVALAAMASLAAPYLLAEPDKEELAAVPEGSVQLTIVTASGGG